MSLQPQNLIAIGVNPRPPLQCHKIGCGVQPVSAGSIWLVTSLPEVHLPGGSSVPSSEPLASHFEVTGIVRVENESLSGKSDRRHAIRKSAGASAKCRI